MLARRNLKLKNQVNSLKWKNSYQNENFNRRYFNLITDLNPFHKIYFIRDDFEEKVKIFSKNPEKLVIISDFDYTLTKRYRKDLNLYSSYCILESSKLISNNFRKLNQDLFKKYSKFENDEKMDFHTRDELMKIWFKENLDLIVEENVLKEHFKAMIIEAEKKFYFRYGILELFQLAHKHNIPFFIISGGLYEIIEESLKFILPFYDKLKEKNLIHILSNRFKYNNKNAVIGYEEPFVYTFNKGEILHKIYHEYRTKEENIIVLGDHLNDTDTIKHIDYNEEIKIGFVNYFEDSLTEQQIIMMEAYQLKYDVCIINDGNLTFINSLIKSICSNRKN